MYTILSSLTVGCVLWTHRLEVPSQRVHEVVQRSRPVQEVWGSITSATKLPPGFLFLFFKGREVNTLT